MLLPELGQLSSQKIGTLGGVAPLNRDSRQMQGKRTIFGDRSAVPQMLYMATLVAVRHNPVIRAFQEQLLKRGNPKVNLLENRNCNPLDCFALSARFLDF